MGSPVAEPVALPARVCPFVSTCAPGAAAAETFSAGAGGCRQPQTIAARPIHTRRSGDARFAELCRIASASSRGQPAKIPQLRACRTIRARSDARRVSCERMIPRPPSKVIGVARTFADSARKARWNGERRRAHGCRDAISKVCHLACTLCDFPRGPCVSLTQRLGSCTPEARRFGEARPTSGRRRDRS